MQPPTQSQGIATTPAPTTPRAPVSITTTGPDGKTHTLTVPTTRADVRALTAHREEISNQLTSVTNRRSELAAEIRASIDPVSTAGLQSRLRLLDQRILQLENDLALTGQQLAAAPSQLVASTEPPSGSSDDFEEGLMAGGFSVLLLVPLAVYFARRRWKRKAAALPDRTAPESARLERLEQGMEAIAIEIERISEGQRFVTKLLSESQAPLGTVQRIPQQAVTERDPSQR